MVKRHKNNQGDEKCSVSVKRKKWKKTIKT